MDTADDPRSLLALLCGERGIHDTRESWLRAGARRAGISYRAAKSIFYQETTDPDHRAVRKIREKLGKAGGQNGAVSITVAEESFADRLARLAAQHEAIARELSELRAAMAAGGDGGADRA